MYNPTAFLGAMFFLFFITLLISLIGAWKKKIGWVVPWLSGFGGGLLIAFLINYTIGLFLGIIFTIILVASSKSKKRHKEVDNSTVSIADELDKLSHLKEKGVLTQEEFEAQKKKLLGN
jgi:uncharacterized membrane protein